MANTRKANVSLNLTRGEFIPHNHLCRVLGKGIFPSPTTSILYVAMLYRPSAALG